jgi:hypothetical protein
MGSGPRADSGRPDLEALIFAEFLSPINKYIIAAVTWAANFTVRRAIAAREK